MEGYASISSVSSYQCDYISLTLVHWAYVQVSGYSYRSVLCYIGSISQWKSSLLRPWAWGPPIDR